MKFRDILEEQLLFEMANIGKSKTGLDESIWISVKNSSHGPRIKIYKNSQPKGENFSVTIEDEPKVIGNIFVNAKELDKIKQFVILNKVNLIKYWNFELTTDEVTDNLFKV